MYIMGTVHAVCYFSDVDTIDCYALINSLANVVLFIMMRFTLVSSIVLRPL